MNSEFKAKLEGVKLSDEAKKRIANGLQDLVLHELARIDNRGDLVVKSQIKLKPTNGIIAVEKDGIINISPLV